MATLHGARRIARNLSLRIALRPILREEDDRKRSLNERAVEYRYALDGLISAAAVRILDVGTGGTAWPAVLAHSGFNITAIDDIGSYWSRGFVNRHWQVHRDDITDSAQPGSIYDAAMCISVLEHIPDHRRAIIEMMRVVRPGGVVLITVPWNESEYVPNAYALKGAGYGQNARYICQIFSRTQLAQWVEDTGATVADITYFRAFTGDYWTEGDRITPPVVVRSDQPHQLAGLTLKKSIG